MTIRLARRLWLVGSSIVLVSTLAACPEAPSALLERGSGREGEGEDADGGGLEPNEPGAPGAGRDAAVSANEGGGTDAGVDAGKKKGGASSITEFACSGGVIKPGWNDGFMVAGRARRLIAEFPSDTTRPMAVIFSWHGYQQDTEQFRKDMQLDPNRDPAIPAIVITPDDTDIPPPFGLDWKIVNPDANGTNLDVAFFEAMTGCLNEQQKIDPTRIYSIGFSAGSVMTSLLHSEHPKILSAIVNISGAWMNDIAQTSKIAFPLNGIAWNWPALDPQHGGNVLLTHGGGNDVTVAGIMNLETSAQAAFPFLKANKRTVVGCGHNNGHTGHPEVGSALIAKFLYAHRAGQPSPYGNGILNGFPGSCGLRLP